jgi:ABC-2 type transport system permease protein
MRGIPILVITLLLPTPYRMELPFSFTTIVLSILVLLLAWLLGGVLNNTLNILTVYLMSADGLAKLFPIVMMFFSGLILPIPLFPSGLQKVLTYTPFSGLMDTPARVIMGHYSTAESIYAMGVQLIWIIIIFVVNDFLLENKLKKIVVQGG